MTNITPASKLNQAREWAKYGKPGHQPETVAAAEVINALPDYWIDAEKVREALDWRDSKPSGDDYDEEFYDRLRALLPAPTPRTLADMDAAEREACQWMQADFEDGIAEHPIRVVITKEGEITADIILPDGAAHYVYADKVTPLPDLPRLEWPASEPVTEDTPTQQERVVTEDDYRNAPSGTVVWGRGPSSGVFSALEKYGNIWLEAGGEGTITPRDMERNGPHEVLRWADGS